MRGQQMPPIGEVAGATAMLRSPSGGIRVTTTERGLPVGLEIGHRELARPADELAADILRLCELSGQNLQVSRRRELVARGVSAAVIQGLKLATTDDLKRCAARIIEIEEEAEPDTRSGPA
ncbi:MAG: hypothetical protein K0R68_2907 [Mycobacterium sp.]|nr:hypothetical protein [Mycobacterium sp.]